MRRTVNISRTPSPRRAMAVPLYTWMRSFWPSRMRWWTSTVSPTWKSGRSVRFSPSTRAMYLFRMAHVLSGLRGPGSPAPAFPPPDRLRNSLCSRRQRASAPWSPLRRTSRTVMPRNSRGRVYCGYSRRPGASLCDSSTRLSSSPSTPGTYRTTVSMTTIAGTSPPLQTKSPTEISRGCKPRRMRSSNPSYRPHNRSSRLRVANSRTTGCVSRSPAGVSRINSPGSGASARTVSTASYTGPGMMTMPDPPPKGRSSTLLCLPSAQSRMFQSRMSTKPLSIASLSRLWVRYPEKISGNKVSTSNRMAGYRGSGRRRRGRFFGLPLLGFLHVLLQERRHPFRRQGADALPILDPVWLERHAGVGVLHLGVVGTQFLDDAAVARLPRIDRDDAEKLPMLPAHLFHANAYGHGATLPRTDSVLLICLTNRFERCPSGVQE